MKKITAEFELKTGKTKDDLDDIQDGLKGVEKGLDAAGKEGKKTNKILKGISNLFKGALGLGIVIKLFDVLKDTFMQNQKVADGFSTVMEALSLAFNDLFNYLENNIGNIVGYFKAIFNDPQQALKDFGVAIKENIIERFNSALEVLGYLGTAIKKVFEGDFDGAMEAAKNAGKEYVDVLTGVDGSVDKIVEGTKNLSGSIVEYGKSTFKAAQEIVKLNKAAEIAAVINQGLIEKYDRQAEQQRQIRDDETKTMEQRIAANTELGRILEEQSEKMLQNAAAIEKAAQAQYLKNDSDENFIALQEAKNESAAIEAQIEGFRSEQKTNLNSLNKEALDLQKEAIETEDERIAKIAELTNFEILTAVQKLQRDRDNALAELDLLEATEAEKQKIRDHYADEEEKLTKLTTANKLDLASNAMGDLAGIFGEESKAGKAAAIAQTTIETYKGATSAFASLSGIPIVGPVLGGIAAAAAVAAGIANVKKITSIGPAVSGGGGSAPSVPQAPSFNVVGAAPENQLAQAIGEDNKQPIKAFVVSNDVTNAQALDRNIVEGASIG